MGFVAKSIRPRFSPSRSTPGRRPVNPEPLLCRSPAWRSGPCARANPSPAAANSPALVRAWCCVLAFHRTPRAVRGNSRNARSSDRQPKSLKAFKAMQANTIDVVKRMKIELLLSLCGWLGAAIPLLL
ncbi:uncharacterized protein LOC133905243 isoform X2 [Phragmites australis]|uniref:uncharacterized protein LOC133905243 isoform X2 n=1 Tax=Phragmites australis TaxID=29695 RepID=UPI002D76C839|nr:uncharacterized protein LOC133905243 isoform X2 [Phragmites australis]